MPPSHEYSTFISNGVMQSLAEGPVAELLDPARKSTVRKKGWFGR